MNRGITIAAAFACFVAGGVYTMDQLWMVDQSTGFCRAGAVWMRYVPVVLLWLLFMLLSRRFIRPDAYPPVVRSGFGGLACLTGAAGLLVWDVLSLPSFSTPLLLAQGVLALLGAVWLLFMARKTFGGYKAAPGKYAIWGILGAFIFYGVTIYRFVLHQSGLVRVGVTMDIYSAAAVLVFSSVLLQALYAPQQGQNGRLWCWGLIAFLMAFCMELPRSILRFVQGRIPPEALALSIVLGAMGLLGLVYAFGCPTQTAARAKNNS